MAIQKKHGKGRLDKWYKLAKEKGYRARAAFKLIQLNRKYGFLEKSKVLLDLCAAPGSWCQVAAECMPQDSLIVGVDLAPIKPIARAITFQSDITTPQCRATIRQHLKTWKADTVLHDGAPNVGTAWVQDAFSQAELVLQSLKLATEFLCLGGTFVTKVFRSKDYNALLWVFNQLFTKVEATKPPSSRNVSAEIFVVCRGFKAPKRLDPRLLDPRSVFAELADPTPNNEAKVFNPEQKKRKREGYEEGDYTQYKEVPASEFIETSDPLAILASVNKLSFLQGKNGDVALAALDRLPETTTEIRNLCADLKVLGRKDFRLLLKWRLRAREIFGFSTKNKDKKEGEGPEEGDAEEVAEVTPMDEELRLQEAVERLQDKESSRRKKERRKDNERKQKEIVRMQMNMTVPTDIGMEQAGPHGEGAMFKLKTVNQADDLDRIAKGKMGAIKPVEAEVSESGGEESDDAEDGLEQQLDDMFEQYQQHRLSADAKYRAKKARAEDPDGEWEGIPDEAAGDSDSFEEDSDSQSESETEETLAAETPLHQVNNGALSNKAALFFDQDIFKEIDEDGDDDEDDSVEANQLSELDMVKADRPVAELQIRSATNKRSSSGSSSDTLIDARAQEEGDSLLSRELASESENDMSDEGEDKSSVQEEGGFEVVKSNASDWDKQGEMGQDGRLNVDIITAEAMTLAHQVASGQKTKHDLVDEGFNRYSIRDKDGLPEWFLDDEDKHSKLQKPITAAAAAAIKEKLRVLNARPIKKVREAKDRKKLRAAQRLEKMKKKSALLADDEGMSEKDKAQSIAKLMGKAAKKKPRKKVTVVVAGGQNKGGGRPKGVKGKYKMVDSRGKKDLRAAKRLAKKRK